MKKKLNLYLLTMIALCFTFIVNAQNEISGTINGSDGIPLAGANVIIKGTVVGTAADFDGNFKISSNTPFPWTLVITSAGYSANEILVDANQDVLNIVLQVSFSELDEVVISASRKPEKITESPASISVMTAKKLELQAVPAGDPTNLLKNIQGVSIVQNGLNKSTISLRGRSVRNSTRTLILKDYRNLVDYYTAIYDNERVPVIPIDIERVEVLRGPSGALWGPGVSAGVIHYISKDPWRHQGLSTEVSYGNSFGEEEQGQAADVTKVDFRWANTFSDKFAFKLIGSYKIGKDFIFDLTSDEDFGTGRTIPDYVAGDVSGAGAGPTRDGQWTDLAGNTIDMTGEGIGIPRGDGGGPFNLIRDFYNLNLEATFEFRPSDKFNFAVVPSFGTSEGNFGNAGIFFYDRKTQFNTQFRTNIGKLFASANIRTQPTFNGDTEESRTYELQYNNTGLRDPGGSTYFDFQAQYPITISDKGDLIVGVDYRTMTRKYEDNFVDGSTNTRKSLGVFEDESLVTSGAYAQYTHKFSDKLRAVGAARIDNWNVYGSAFSPKLGMVYNPKPSSAFRISYNQANTVPSMIRTFFQSNVGRRGQNVQGNLIRMFYGTGEDLTFRNPLTGLSIPGNTLGFHFQGTDVPLQTILNALGVDGITLTGTSAGSLFTLENTASNAPIDNPQQLNNLRAEFETSETIEIGYKGQIGDKLAFGVDFYHNTETNVPTAAVAISPGVAFPNLGDDLAAALSNAGVDATTTDDIVNRAVDQFGNGVTGIVISDQHQALNSINGITYGFRGYGEIKYFGIDLSSEYYFNADNSVFFNWAWVNQNDFTSEDIGEDPALNRVFQLNTPKNRIRAGYNYKWRNSFFGNISMQHNGGYFANFGDFRGELDAVTSVDLAIGYEMSEKVKLSLSATNLFDADIYGLPYLPKQGRFIMTTLRFTP